MPTYIRLTNYKDSDSKKQGFFKPENRYTAKQDDFEKIPGSPIAYWVSNNLINIFTSSIKISDEFYPSTGIQTGDNTKYIRKWHEVSLNDSNIAFGNKWFKLNNGGEFRKWYGNFVDLLLWENNGKKIKENKSSVVRNEDKYFKVGITWNRIATDGLNMRNLPENFIFDQSGDSLFFKESNCDLKNYLLAFFNTKIAYTIMKIIAPTLNLTAGGIADFPIVISKSESIVKTIDDLSKQSVNISKQDWDSYETSWDFTSLPLLQNEYKKSSLEESYKTLRAFWQTQVDTMKKLEEENNDIFIKAYGLEDELKPEVPLKEITLTCNPSYRYDDKKSTEELEALLLADTVKEYISYAVGVMFGRYSLDHAGLHIANQDESIEEANQKFGITNPTFEADSDNVIPILDGEWFIDDISERFFQFVKVTFGSESYESNLDFIANALSDKNKNSVETIRKYFLKDFYTDHVKRYKKRPIYWLFSSPKGSFQALIYMHRYKSDTVSVVLNDYLREFITKLEATRENLEALSIKSDASGSQKSKALKEIENIKKMIKELREYEKDVLYPLATEKIEIDLDDGVKVNYSKFGSALKKIVGLDSGE